MAEADAHGRPILVQKRASRTHVRNSGNQVGILSNFMIARALDPPGNAMMRHARTLRTGASRPPSAVLLFVGLGSRRAGMGSSARLHPAERKDRDGRRPVDHPGGTGHSRRANRRGRHVPAEIRRLAGPASRVIDLQGRTVIPGLIDSHLHAIRAALSFATEVNWIGAPSLTEALRRISQAAEDEAAGCMADRRGRMERAAVRREAPAHAGRARGGGAKQPGVRPARIRLDRDDGRRVQGAEDSRPTRIFRPAVAWNATPHRSRPAPSPATTRRWSRSSTGCRSPPLAQQIEGTKAFFRELNRLGITGVVDPGGNNLLPGRLCRRCSTCGVTAQMTVRVAYSLQGQTPGSELRGVQAADGAPADGVRRRHAAVQRPWRADHRGDEQQPQADRGRQEAYYQIARWAAGRGMGLTMHWGPDATVDQLLTIFERVNREVPHRSAALVDRAPQRCVSCEPSSA